MEHMHFQQTHLPFWPRNSAIGGRKNDIFAQILGNRVAGNVLRRTIQHTCLQNADVDATSSMWLSAKDCPGDLLAPVIAHAIRQSVVSMLAKGEESPATPLCHSPETRWPVWLWSRHHGPRDHKICIAWTQALESDKAEQQHEWTPGFPWHGRLMGC